MLENGLYAWIEAKRGREEEEMVDGRVVQNIR